MVHKSVPPPLVLVSGDVPRVSDQPTGRRLNDDSSSRMNDEGCPNENLTVDVPTGYSKEEEEA